MNWQISTFAFLVESRVYGLVVGQIVLWDVLVFIPGFDVMTETAESPANFCLN